MAASEAPTPRPVESMSFEEARDELALIVQSLEQGSQTLEDSLQLWERGEALAARCEQWLKGARERLERAREEQQAPADSADKE
ncbi:MAG: exodeoxyribonuclease VII small subunit [Gulosibacter sp.]|uniref:exodeoxyribonuclease VII small subunit n=1 Tax=Gulosibacter sp. TaxID=2817531 RepID=UPI003F902702